MSSSTLQYTAPLADMAFLRLGLQSNALTDSQLQSDYFVLQQAAKFAEDVLAPINRECDEQGCQFIDGQVQLPVAMKAAFKTYASAGWMGVAMPEQWGGQAQTETLAASIGEMLTSSNHAFSMKPALTISACRALISHGSKTLQDIYLPNMIAGKWTGTMCMTEAHCGSDLGLIRTKAVEHDGGYLISGNKIFISSGEHDASENIIHLVLARLPESPAGIKGLSLFLVPKKLEDSQAQWVVNNHVTCIGIEDKMGIHASPTCSLNFEQSTGCLVGEINGGIQAMFTMMNEMRLGTCLQGVGLSERAYQKSLAYARERTQMRSLSGKKQPDQDADYIIEHPDVRRMLLTQKAFADGGRALAYFCAQLLDTTHGQDDKDAQDLLDLLTPIAKGFCTETGLESASLGIQVFGGHGFVREHGAEQLYRDGRIGTLYEGTTGIQALDLLGRKVLANQGKSLKAMTKLIHVVSAKHKDNPELSHLAQQLSPYAKQWGELSMKIGMKAMKNHDEVGGASVDFLMYSGYVVLAYFHLIMAIEAKQLLNDNVEYPELGIHTQFLQSKVQIAEFYFARILPRTKSLEITMQQDLASLAPIWG
jgi:alkylation response protein AidB-like acyl-CoA dehydrogenase